MATYYYTSSDVELKGFTANILCPLNWRLHQGLCKLSKEQLLYANLETLD